MWPKPITTEATNYLAVARELARPRLLGVSVEHLRWALGALLVLAVVARARTLPEPGFSALLGFTLFFVGFGCMGSAPCLRRDRR